MADLSWLGQLGAAAIGLGGSIYSTERGMNASSNMMHANEAFTQDMYNRQLIDNYNAEMRANRRWYEQYDYTKSGQLALLAAQTQQQKELAEYMFKNFESPAAVAKAMRQAGLNPSALAGSGSPIQSLSVPGVSMPSGSPPGMMQGSPASPFSAGMPGIPSLDNPANSMANILSQLALASKNSSESGYLNAQTDRLLATAEDFVQQQHLQTGLLKIAEAHQGLILSIDQIYKNDQEKAKMRLLFNQAFTASAQGHYYEALEGLTDAQAEMQKMKNFEESPYAANYLYNYSLAVSEIESRIHNLRGQTYMFTQSGREMQLRNDIQETQNLIFGFTNIYQAKHAVPERLRRYIEQASAKNLITQADAEAANKLLNRMQRYNNLDEWQKDAISITDYIMDKIGGAAGAAAGAYVGARTPRKATSTAQGAWNSFEQWVHSR